ncbi:MAG: flagellar basal body-associated FliL family protein [Desulfovibrio sp.]|nr:flagellar basal body-associated FliL family protein [Desulfovibrio sp.]
MAAKDNKDKEKDIALPEGQAEKPKKKSRAKKLIIIFALLFLILGCAGLGAYWWFYMRAPVADGEIAEESAARRETSVQTSEKPEGEQSLNSAKIERQSDLPRSGGMVLPLPTITVNLNDPGGRRYLKLGMEVEVNADVAAQLKAQNPRIRDAIIMLLAGKTYGEVATPDGKVMLKAEIAARLNQILGAPRVMRVYFTDFVVE